MLIRSTILFVLFTSLTNADDIEMEVRSSQIFKMLRDMSNQTAAESLNLPANASSIRENITDTFSCENRTYGYYADVDNDCQIFHVCLPSQTPSGRNVTYRWSFICPNETIFNQEVLVCTRPIDSIPCEEAPMFYDVNNEIGKVPNNTKKHDTNDETNTNKIYTDTNSRPKEEKGKNNPKNIRPNERFTNTKPVEKDTKKIDTNTNTNSIEKDSNKQDRDRPTNFRPNSEKDTNKQTNRPIRRRPDIQKQNLMSETDMEQIVNQEMSDKVEDFGADIENVENIFPIIEPSETEPYAIENKDRIIIDEDERLIMERNLGNFFRFQANV